MGDRGGCATGPCRTPTTLGHPTKTESKQLYLIHRNKHREAAKTRRQRNVGQMKEQIKTPEKELHEMGISTLSDAEFKTLVIRMLKELREDLSNVKKIQSERKDTQIEIKNNLKGNNSRVDEAKNQINDLEHKEAKMTNKNNKKKKRIQKNEDSISSLWDKFKRCNIHIKGEPEGEEKEQETGNLSEKK